jgi:hypothetical protein
VTSVLVGMLSTVGLMPRQPQGARRQAGILLRGLLSRATE